MCMRDGEKCIRNNNYLFIMCGKPSYTVNYFINKQIIPYVNKSRKLFYVYSFSII